MWVLTVQPTSSNDAQRDEWRLGETNRESSRDLPIYGATEYASFSSEPDRNLQRRLQSFGFLDALPFLQHLYRPFCSSADDIRSVELVPHPAVELCFHLPWSKHPNSVDQWPELIEFLLG
jgi:hypothetical protein